MHLAGQDKRRQQNLMVHMRQKSQTIRMVSVGVTAAMVVVIWGFGLSCLRHGMRGSMSISLLPTLWLLLLS